jgi:sulfur relay (sulfurtransferase) DsrF/TusC family protein
MAPFGEAVGSEAMQAVAAQFQTFAADPVFMVSESLD